ncbi:DUF2142 domain-containing protein [Candidatus Magnetominusculus dajiuhuensis]|uniref:DUF2142 domain-containing protein n=1 Tax=Candidatus Magnetominusculus dajiuhuensis TaxID=3137712 RepID=UPI003B42ACA6
MNISTGTKGRTAQSHTSTATPTGINGTMNDKNTAVSKGGISPEWVFLLVSVVFGYIFVFVTPPFQAPDEYHHMFRAYHVSMGGLVSSKAGGISGAQLPVNLGNTVINVSTNLSQHPNNKQKLSDLGKVMHIPLEPEKTVFYFFPNTARYAPVMYAPQALGIFVGRLLHIAPIFIMYLGRITNLIVWIALIYIAIVATPVYKWLFVLLALTPMSLFLGASLSADAFTNAVAFVFAALIFKAAFGGGAEVSTRELALIFLAAVMLSLSKQVYVPVLLIFLMIPVSKFGSLKRYVAIVASFFVVNAAMACSWFFMSGDLLVPLREKLDISPQRQLYSITHHPLDFIIAMKNTLFKYSSDVLTDFIGKLGWLDTELPAYIHVTFWGLLIFTALCENSSDIAVKIKDKAIAAVAFVSTTFLIVLSQYLTWTEVDKNIIDGLTGRYFIPVATALFLLFYNNKFHINTKRPLFGILILSYLAVIMISTIAAMITRYYL